MKFGDNIIETCRDPFTGKKVETHTTYKRVSWGDYHTNDRGEGLWHNDRQILGTCQFTVRGCETEKAAKAKIRKHVS